jgi:hypothetical protein
LISVLIMATGTSYKRYVLNYYILTIILRRKKNPSLYPLQHFIATTSIYIRRATVGVNGEGSIPRVARERGQPYANLGRISQRWQPTAPAGPFTAVLGPITSAVSAKFGSVSKETAGKNIITRLESITR